jgi:molecular chaperone GrpE (heat shock protein)
MSTVARTAVIAGTATAVSNKVSASGQAKAQAKAAQQQQQQAAAEAAAAEQQAALTAQDELANLKTQLEGLQAQQADAAALGGPGAMMAQMQQLAELKQAGMLTDEEFAAMKAKLLAG